MLPYSYRNKAELKRCITLALSCCSFFLSRFLSLMFSSLTCEEKTVNQRFLNHHHLGCVRSALYDNTTGEGLELKAFLFVRQWFITEKPGIISSKDWDNNVSQNKSHPSVFNHLKLHRSIEKTNIIRIRKGLGIHTCMTSCSFFASAACNTSMS